MDPALIPDVKDETIAEGAIFVDAIPEGFPEANRFLQVDTRSFVGTYQEKVALLSITLLNP